MGTILASAIAPSGDTGSGVGNAVLDVATLGASAGQRAAGAQGRIAEAQLAQQRSDREQALKYAEATPEELAQLNRAIALNEGDIARKEKLIASSDPALLEAGSQALKLLRGEDAKVLGPLRNNIAKQESALREKLQAQLGPGYENTTAGIQALQAFNEQSNLALTSAQESSLSKLLGVAQDTSSRYGAQTNIANAGTLTQLFGNIQGRKVNALTGSPITGAGAQFVGDMQSARNSSQSIGQLLQLGGTIAGMAGGNPFAGGGQVQTQVMPTGNISGMPAGNPYAV